jgi:aspartokinase
MKNPNMALYVRSTFSDLKGTLIGPESDESKNGIVGIAKREDDDDATHYKITLVGRKMEDLSASILGIAKQTCHVFKHDFTEDYVSVWVNKEDADHLIVKLHQLLLAGL